jgi:phosphoserine phosphatase
MRAHIFDMDGTLVPRTSGPALVAAALGRHDSLVELEQRFASGTATAAEFARVLHETWGVVSPEVALQAFSAAPLLENIREVLQDIRRRGEVACLITMSPDYFAEHFLEFGFHDVFASRFPRSTEVPLDEAQILNPEDKPRLAARFCAEHGVALQDAVAYGDSMSDVFLFREVGLGVSVNGDHHLAELAGIAVEGSDLMLAYRAARAWCDRAANGR